MYIDAKLNEIELRIFFIANSVLFSTTAIGIAA